MANTKIQSEQIEDDIALGGNPTTTTQSAGNNTTRVATTAFVTTAVANLVDSAPSALDTLNELAAAMGDDASFSTTITNSIATKLPLAGGTMTGNIAHASDFTLDVGGDITFDAGGGDFVFADDGTTIGAIVNSSTNFVVKSAVSNSDLLLQGNDGGSIITALTLDMSEAGAAHFNTQVGIGSAPVTGYGHLQVRNGFGYINEDGSNTKQMYLRTNYDTGNPAIQVATAHDLLFATSNTTRMTIDSSGNVGIGTSNPLQKTHSSNGFFTDSFIASFGSVPYSSARPGVALDYASDGARLISWGTASARGTYSFIQLENDGQNQQTALTIDSSGDLIVGGTSSGANDAVSISNTGYIQAIVNGDTVGYFNRRTSDGEIIRLQKDGSTVATFASDSGSMLMGSGDVGVYFDAASDRIIPMNMSTLAVRNDAIDIGGNPHRFKDLYLSGGVFLGGTGSANELDDYEEGSHEPTVTGSSSGSFTLSSTGNSYAYTKIGRTVHVQGYLSITGGSGSGSLRISMPFTAASMPDDQGYSFGSGLVQNNGTTVAGQKYSFVSDGANYFDIYKVNDAGSAAGFQAGDCDTNFQIGFNFSFIAS